MPSSADHADVMVHILSESDGHFVAVKTDKDFPTQADLDRLQAIWDSGALSINYDACSSNELPISWKPNAPNCQSNGIACILSDHLLPSYKINYFDYLDDSTKGHAEALALDPSCSTGTLSTGDQSMELKKETSEGDEGHAEALAPHSNHTPKLTISSRLSFGVCVVHHKTHDFQIVSFVVHQTFHNSSNRELTIWKSNRAHTQTHTDVSQFVSS